MSLYGTFGGARRMVRARNRRVVYIGADMSQLKVVVY